MRTILVFGLITLFALVSFVPPQGGNVAIAQAQEVTIHLNGNVSSALTTVKNQGDLFMKNIVPKVSVQVPKIDLTIPTDVKIDLKDPKQSIEDAAPSLIKRLVTFTAKEVQKNVNVQLEAKDVPADWRKAAEAEPNETLKQHFLLIEWAREKHDIRACNELQPTVLEARTVGSETFTTPAPGDWIAYCLARVTQSTDRCLQINPSTLPPLRSLCEQELK